MKTIKYLMSGVIKLVVVVAFGLVVITIALPILKLWYYYALFIFNLI